MITELSFNKITEKENRDINCNIGPGEMMVAASRGGIQKTHSKLTDREIKLSR